MLRLALHLLLALGLTACAGRHVRPDANYSLELPPSTLRIAFDQEGSIYPEDSTVVPWSTATMHPVGEAFGRNAFRLSGLTKTIDGKAPYTPELKQATEDRAVAKLNSALNPDSTLIVLVHGFNESYADAQRNYRLLRRAIGKTKHQILEVHWDGLKIPFGGIGHSSRVSFWPNAVLYSNLAGQFGVRRVLARIDKPVNIRYLTFSRGAAVALSSVTNPVYDTKFKAYARPPLALDNPNIRSVKLGLLAAAVGAGHINDAASSQMPRPVEIIVGVNPKDFAVSKLGLAGEYGDTRLGSDVEFTRSQISARRSNLKITGVLFSHGSGHSVAKYAFLGGSDSDILTEAMSCFLHLLDLRPASCSNSLLIQGAGQ